jgi:hypothetical protein
LDLLRHKRELHNGFGDGLTRAFELAVTPAIFGALGFAIDRTADVFPLFTFLLGLLAVIGMFVKLWYAYDAEMRAHEAASPWGLRAGAEHRRDG